MKLCLVIALVACAKQAAGPPDAAPGTIVVHEDTSVLRQGGVGTIGQRDATYVFVDVDNKGADDRQVAVTGTLVDSSGATVAQLSLDELRIPAGKTRTFALVATPPAPNAASVKLVVQTARKDVGVEPLVVSDIKPEPDGEYLGASALVTNNETGEAKATVIASFHDADGRIVGRPFTTVSIPAHGQKRVTFDGRKNAVTVDVFVGQVGF
jgi:hypothetical protein